MGKDKSKDRDARRAGVGVNGFNTKSPSVIDSYKVNMSFYLSFVVVAPGSSVLPSIHERYSDQHTPAVFNAMKLKHN